MTESEMYVALRPRPPARTWIVLCVLCVCAAGAWLGWCGVEVARAVNTAAAVRACSSVDMTWLPDGSCTQPPIEVHLAPPSAHNPLTGPGGA